MNEWMEYLDDLEYMHDDDMQVAIEYVNKYGEESDDE